MFYLSLILPCILYVRSDIYLACPDYPARSAACPVRPVGYYDCPAAYMLVLQPLCSSCSLYARPEANPVPPVAYPVSLLCKY